MKRERKAAASGLSAETPYWGSSVIKALHRAVAALLLTFAVLCAGLFAGQAAESAVVSQMLVSNIWGVTTGSASLTATDHAQQFTTGSNAGGYTVTSLKLVIANGASTSFTVDIYTNTNGAPGSKLGTLTPRFASIGSGHKMFLAGDDGIDLDAETSYFLVIDSAGGGTTAFNLTRPGATDAEIFGLPDWTITGATLSRSSSATTGSWSTHSNQFLRMHVTGKTRGNAAPVFSETSYTFPLAENSVGLTTPIQIGTVVATDADAGDTVTYRIHESPLGFIGPFITVDSSTGVVSYTGGGENYEHPLAHARAVVVRASDGKDEAHVTVKLKTTDVDEPADSPTITIYHDPNHSPAAVSRYDAAIQLLTDAGRPYLVRLVTGTSEVDWLAKVSNSTMPRFFLDDPKVHWKWGPSKPKVNNGGLRWLRSVLESSTTNSVPAFGEASYTFDLAENADGSTTPVSVGTVSATDADTDDTVTYSITAGNTDSKFAIDSSTGAITYTGGGEDYEGFETPASAFSLTVQASDGTGHSSVTVTVAVTDVSEAADAPTLARGAPTITSTFTIYHDPNDSATVSRYDTAIGLLKAAGQSYVVRTVTGTGEVERLAGVSNSVMPRFFLGDPAATGWGPPQAKVNHGGLRWLRKEIAKLPSAVSVADARVTEAADAMLIFTVKLNQASASTGTVDYATADGTATAGQDYTATSGTLTFAPGETFRAVTVPVLDDVHDEGEETLTLTLSNPSGIRLADGEATGTIVNSDPLQQAWLARFGRTVATHVTDAVGERLRRRPEQGSHLTVGGQRLSLGAPAGRDEAGTGAGASASGLLQGLAGALGLGPAQSGTGGAWEDGRGPDPRLGQSRTLTLDLRQILLGSSFRLALNGADAGATSPRLTAWGRFAGTTFDGQDGALAVTGDVFTGTVGVDSEWERLLAGVAVAHSRGDGSFNDSNPDMEDRGRGGLENTLTSIHPYVRYAVTDRLDVWGLVGYGWGELDLELANDETLETDMNLVMGAVGGRGVLLSPAESGGYQLATRTDAMFTRTTSDAVANSAATDADAHRLRVILEGSRGVTWADGRSLTPTVELGLRHDWGDAETGFGVEMGGRVQYADPGLGLTVEAAVRGLLAHEDSEYDEWGASGTVRLDPGAGGQGLALTLAPTWGAASSGVDGLWARQTTSGLAPQGRRGPPAGQLNAEVSYGLRAFELGLLTPYAGTSLAQGGTQQYRLGGRLAVEDGLTLNLEGSHQQQGGQTPMDTGLLLRLEMPW